MRRVAIMLAAAAAFLAPAVEARAPDEAVVTARLTPDGVHATVVLSRPVTRFAFAQTDVVRQGDFELLTPGLGLADDAVTATKPFRRFALRIRPMSQERDAKYPAHYRVGSGGVVYGPALKGDPSQWRTRLTFATAPGERTAPDGGELGEGFVFIGPAALLSEDAQLVVAADPATPTWLVERSRRALGGAVRAFTEELEAELPRKPLLIVKHQDGPRNFNVGDVTKGAVTALRFHGPAWTQPDDTAAKQIESFVSHEAFHFWNGGLASHAPETPTWLHEGGAEYASLLAGLRSGVLDEADARRRLGEALQRCRSGLQNQGDKAMGALPFLSTQVRYPCGMVLQWAADLHVRRATAQGRTVLDAWADMIRVARRRPGRTYTLADFYAAAAIRDGASFRPAALLVSEAGAARWDALVRAMNDLGAEVTQAESATTRRAALLFHLLRENCRGLKPGTGYGFYGNLRTVTLDSPEGCGVLSGNPEIRSIEGGEAMDTTAETYAAVQRKCAAGAAVMLTKADGGTLSAVCAKPLAAAAQDYVVLRRLAPASAPGTAAGRGSFGDS